MISVRAAHSLFSPRDLAKALEGRFVLPPIDACGLYRSFVNDTYWVRAGGETFYFRVYQAGWRTAAQAAAEMEIIERLAVLGASVARPVPLIDGGFVAEFSAAEGPRAGVLLREAPGHELDYTGEQGRLNARRYGCAVASLHVASADLTPVPARPAMDAEAMIRQPAALLLRELASAEDREVLGALGLYLIRRIEEDRELSVGFAHGDLNGSNIHFSGEVATIIDFDCCGWSWRANDIAAFLRGVTRYRQPGREASILIGAYLDGYRSVRPIATADLEALSAFLYVQRLWMAGLHVAGQDRWGAGSFGVRYLRQLMAWLCAWRPVLDGRPDWLD